MPNWRKVIVSGSDASLNSLTVATYVSASSFTGSHFGTSSYAIQALSSSYALSASYWSGSVVSASYAQTSSYAVTFTINSSVISTATSASTSVGSNVIFNQPTGSYNAAFYKYSALNGVNARVGEVFASFTNGTVAYTEFSTIDNGSTTNVTMSAAIVGSNVQLLAQTNTSGWTIKSQVTYL
jgi:hypothetical protein